MEPLTGIRAGFQSPFPVSLKIPQSDRYLKYYFKLPGNCSPSFRASRFVLPVSDSLDCRPLWRSSV